MAWLVFDIDVRKVQELIQDDDSILVDIKRGERRVENVELEVVVGLKKFVIVTKLFPRNCFIFILIISQLEKELNII